MFYYKEDDFKIISFSRKKTDKEDKDLSNIEQESKEDNEKGEVKNGK